MTIHRLVWLLVALPAAAAQAEIYACTGKGRLPVYQNFPCQFDRLASASNEGAATAPATRHGPESLKATVFAPKPAAPRVGMTTEQVKAIWGQPVGHDQGGGSKGRYRDLDLRQLAIDRVRSQGHRHFNSLVVAVPGGVSSGRSVGTREKEQMHSHIQPASVAAAPRCPRRVAARSRSASASALGGQPERRSEEHESVGHTDLQGRPTYQPNVIQYPDGRTILFVGMHSGVPVPGARAARRLLPNPLNGGACENNGTMIIDVTDPANPVEKALIPAPPGGQSQMVRMCLGSQLPGGNAGQGLPVAQRAGRRSGRIPGLGRHRRRAPRAEIVADRHPLDAQATGGNARPASGTRRAARTRQHPGTPLWRQSQAMLIYDWTTPKRPVYIRTFGLPGGQPGATGTVPNSLHGPISAHDHPQAAQKLARAARRTTSSATASTPRGASATTAS